MDEALLDEIKEKVLPLLNEQGVELIELFCRREQDRQILQFLVERPGGITLDECARLNQKISQMLDANSESLLSESYILEVASPGLDRPLRSTRDFQRNLGKLVRIVLHQAVNGQNVWLGSLDEADEETVTLRSENKQRVHLARQNIARAKLEVRV